MSTNKDLFGEDSSSDEDENEDTDQKMESPAPAPAAKPKSIHDADTSDDDDDDDDNQFDDKGAVVGLPSSTMAGTKLNSTAPTSAKDDGDDDNADSDVDMADAAPKGPTILKSKLVAQQHSKVPEGVGLYMTKLPNLLGIQTQAFDTSTYAPALEEQEFGQSVYNLLRWRYKRDASGNLVRENDVLVRESNTRLVEWEDGSYTLHIGNEAFEVDALETAKNGFPGLNGYLYQSQTAAVTVPSENSSEESPAGTILECTGPVKARLTVRPSSLQSDSHKSLTVGIRQKTIKTARIAQYVTQEDPEKAKQERIRVKDDLEKSNVRKRSYGGGGGGGGGGHRRPRMSRGYLEEEDGDYDTFNVKDAKRRAREGDEDEDLRDFGDDSSSSEDEYDQTFNKRGSAATKKGGAANNKAAAEGDDDDDDDEDDVQMQVSVKPKKTTKAVFEDSDSD